MVERRIGVPDIADLLADRLPASDLQSLLMAVWRRHAERVGPAELLERLAKALRRLDDPVGAGCNS